jgi:uncharacterized protein (TIGR02453 family)
MIHTSCFEFLKKLAANNNRDWFTENKNDFLEENTKIKIFFNEIFSELNTIDSLDKMQIFRIYKDVRFSKDKLPYKTHFSVGFSRTKPMLRGGMYLHIENNESFVGGGFWNPEPADLLRIRKEIEQDDSELRTIIANETFQKLFKTIHGDEVKSAPKGFDKNHKAIDLIKKKQFLITRKFTNSEVLNENFKNEVLVSFKAMRPFFDYMSDVLSTDANGESIL